MPGANDPETLWKTRASLCLEYKINIKSHRERELARNIQRKEKFYQVDRQTFPPMINQKMVAKEVVRVNKSLTVSGNIYIYILHD